MNVKNKRDSGIHRVCVCRANNDYFYLLTNLIKYIQSKSDSVVHTSE